ncbi:protein abhd-3.2-like [Hordeum vulgare subsp. vulgare]|uniref:protein abhd-3.2-like n=1 Tax=Hordeum vulgare subsp. vulgare TaxID=112509 RepID=UPI001D1A3623|nr:protein abhd-3.2-like [Hordeum vulgare subsp. vulgare]
MGARAQSSVVGHLAPSLARSELEPPGSVDPNPDPPRAQESLFLLFWLTIDRLYPLYCRQLYTVRDGGTIALDWLLAFDLEDADGIISKDSSTPLLVVVPGLTSDSDAAYAKHLVHSMARKGWNVVVSNHRGLGGVSITVTSLI